MSAKQKLQPSTANALPARTHVRGRRILTGPEIQVQKWVRKNRGVLTRLAKEFDLSVTFIQAVTYGRTSSKDWRVESKLATLGCPGHRKA